MITYLNEKDNEKFIYAGYLEPVVNQTETLYAYPRLLGNDYGMKTVTVKATKERFTDDYSDRSIVDYAEEMANDFIIEYFNSNQVEEFAVNYSKWLYEHELNGRHRINVVKNYSIKDMIYGKIKEYYNSDDYVGFYSFAFDSDKTNIIPVSHIGYEVPDEYAIGEYFDKYSK